MNDKDMKKLDELTLRSDISSRKIEAARWRMNELSELKDEYVRNADYEAAARTRDQMEQIKKDVIAPLVKEGHDIVREYEKVLGISPSGGSADGDFRDHNASAFQDGLVKRSRGEFLALRQAMCSIKDWSNPDAPGVYEPKTIAAIIAAINGRARRALDMNMCKPSEWAHLSNRTDPREEGLLVEVPSLIKMALSKLSGDLSHDNIAEAKQILKNILG